MYIHKIEYSSISHIRLQALYERYHDKWSYKSADQLSRFTLDIQGIYHSVKGKNEKY